MVDEVERENNYFSKEYLCVLIQNSTLNENVFSYSMLRFLIKFKS